ncbi:LysE family translocator [Rhodospirillaceae bacterium KN72]|uniref:LysE family translocator n=1 Tax=Pacificispira spongiicola TaxID=2729598 RepID=A0A7Y0E1A6_9PROT|nr:LysE family translocator [Pacificispira spongiicola]NMM44596.1 LysE family translocator [Pacificispira spongiicola]
MVVPELDRLILFATASLALYLSPGPDMLYIASRALGGSVRAGVLAGLGVSIGIVCHMLAAGFGLAALLIAVPAAFIAVKWCGAAYLAYLGIKAWLGAGDQSGFRKAAPASDWAMLRQGILVNLLNPKIALFFLAFIPQFVDPAQGHPTAQFFFFGMLFTVGGLFWVLIQAVLFARAGRWLTTRPAALKWQQRVSGTVLLGLAANLALSD